MTVRRARPLLGTLVEVGVVAPDADRARFADVAFDAIASVQTRLSRFEPTSDVARFNALAAGDALDVGDDLRTVLEAAAGLRDETEGAFDVSIGSAPQGWQLEGTRLLKTDPHARLDLGGIGKGHAVDRGVAALQSAGASAGWVNAGGDLRVFGDLDLPIALRDEARGGVRACALLRDGAFASSHWGDGGRSVLAGGTPRASHVSVAAPSALFADALTKVVALSGDVLHPAIVRRGARARIHAGP